jgi:hypothetical protein
MGKVDGLSTRCLSADSGGLVFIHGYDVPGARAAEGKAIAYSRGSG